MQESAVMAKDETIIMRVDGETKKKIEHAARSRGLTVTTFVTEAAVRAAEKAGRRVPKYAHPQTSNVPPSFYGFCDEARRGGAYGYERAGAALANWALSTGYTMAWVDNPKAGAASPSTKIPTRGPRDPAWGKDLRKLKTAAADEDDVAVLDWFDAHYESAMSEIPKRRRDQFLHGVYDALKGAEKRGNHAR